MGLARNRLCTSALNVSPVRRTAFAATAATSVVPPPAAFTATAATAALPALRFSHIHVYSDSLKPLEEYKRLEAKLNDFAKSAAEWTTPVGANVAVGRDRWLALHQQHGDPVSGPADPTQYSPAGQDLVEQLLVAVGFRITGVHTGPATRSLVITSSDPHGVKFVVTSHADHKLDELVAASEQGKSWEKDELNHFDASHLERFAKRKNCKQGAALLGFTVSQGDIERIHAKYAELHPKLLMPGNPRQYGDTKVLEVYAYYLGESKVTDADPGTVLRFVETLDGRHEGVDLPGVEGVQASFDGISPPAYSDHWVSNVVSREGFLDTLNDTLGFSPKVDFNAGVVAAGEAQIESTVTGNSPGTFNTDMKVILRDQSQVYLPTNNALSEVGHVHLFLEQLGQGIQHMASRVQDLPKFIQRANDYRKMTGSGLTFLMIPHSYYGYLNAKRLAQDSGISMESAERCFAALRTAGIVDSMDIVDLDATHASVAAALPEGTADKDSVVTHVLRSRYSNLYALLRDHLSEESYLQIVRNNILVDIQGEDLLMQIFSSSVLQRNIGEEAPFLEFIQRVCSECVDPATGQPKPIRPGCGGFGIRNFLTLFLSIEVSKATTARAAAELAGDLRAAALNGRMIEAFTSQLDESNPILTQLSDAMTAEGGALDRGDLEGAKRWADVKAAGQDELMRVSAKYNALLKKLRQEA